ncbi:hypothetical protein H0H93_003681 [Arthromyces matolae]|nr:hypothetical protein H0H93_003681 [Arthromyces matolae]
MTILLQHTKPTRTTTTLPRTTLKTAQTKTTTTVPDEVAHVAGELAALAESLPDFAHIQTNAGSRSLKNQEIMEIWEFRAAFWDCYHRHWCSEVTKVSNIGYKRITNECIGRALKIVHSTIQISNTDVV